MDFWLGLFFSAQWLLCLWWWHFCGGLANKQSIDTVSILVFWSHQVNKLEPWHIVHIMKQLNRHSIDRLQLPWLRVSVSLWWRRLKLIKTDLKYQRKVARFFHCIGRGRGIISPQYPSPAKLFTGDHHSDDCNTRAKK